jgi:hypothetical protein
MDQHVLQVVNKLRDHKILTAFSTIIPTFAEKVPIRIVKQATSLSLSPEEAAWALTDPEIDLPLISAEEDAPPERYYVDPITDQQYLPFNSTLVRWGAFQESSLREQLLGDQSLTNRFLGRAIRRFFEKYGPSETQRFIWCLWRHRWIYDSWTCSAWLSGTIADQRTDAGRRIFRRIAEGREGEEQLRTLESWLLNAKDNVTTLDDWFELLYLISPWIGYTRTAFEQSDSTDSLKHVRWLDEASADLGAVFITGVSSILNQEVEAPHYWSISLPGRSLDPDVFKMAYRDLEFGYRSRIKYPRFWIEAVRSALETGADVHSIGQYSHQRLLSIFITYAPIGAGLSLGGRQP